MGLFVILFHIQDCVYTRINGVYVYTLYHLVNTIITYT
jgi:hypothetical protein